MKQFLILMCLVFISTVGFSQQVTYSKDVFGRFLALLNKDISKIFLLESTKKAFTN